MNDPRFQPQPLSSTANLLNRSPNLTANPFSQPNTIPSMSRNQSAAQIRGNFNVSNKTRQYPSIGSRVMDSQADVNLTAMIEDGEVFPHDMLLLLTNEARNIKAFKDKTDKEKNRVVKDFEVFKKEISHIIDDLKLSIVAELDILYKSYIEKYAMLKSEIMEIRRLKKQIYSQNLGQSEISKMLAVQHNTSNLDIVRQLEDEVNSMRGYKVSNYINELQRRKLTPLTELSKQLIIMTSSSADFYDSSAMVAQLAELKQNFSHFTKHMFAALTEFVKAPRVGGNPNTDNLLKGIDLSKGIDMSKVSERPHAVSINRKTRRQFSISQSQQILATDWAEDIALRHVNTIQSDHQDIILCGIVINNKYLVTGGKDAQLIVQTLDGERVTSLVGHEASICTLALIEDKGQIYLASGSDHGDNSIIIWDPLNWSIKAKIRAHTAAVTSIVDLCDGQTLVSGSYDKKINVYNYKKSTLLFSLPNNKSSVTSMLLNSARNKLVSCGFDSMMFVWSIVRDQVMYSSTQTGVVEAISIERVIQNNSIICCLSGSMLRPETIVAGTKDGKIKFWNINSGEVEKTLAVNNNLIIDMVLIERESKPNFPMILSCSSKDRSLVLTRSDTGTNSIVEVGNRNYIEFGCGISPKMVFARYETTPMLGLVSQHPESREVNMFEVDLK